MSTYAKMACARVSVRCLVADAVPELVVIDPLRVAQVLANGVTNALKLTSAGLVELHVRVAHVRGDRYLLFQVLDTGPGLQGTDYCTLFDPTREFDERKTRACTSGTLAS